MSKRCSVFVAASWLRIDDARRVAAALRSRGHVVTSRWHSHDVGAEDGDVYINGEVMTGHASIGDMQDLRIAGALVELTGDGEKQKSRGGRLVEFGGALFIGKRVVVLGPREHVHHLHPAVRVVKNVEELLEVLA